MKIITHGLYDLQTTKEKGKGHLLDSEIRTVLSRTL